MAVQELRRFLLTDGVSAVGTRRQCANFSPVRIGRHVMRRRTCFTAAFDAVNLVNERWTARSLGRGHPGGRRSL